MTSFAWIGDGRIVSSDGDVYGPDGVVPFQTMCGGRYRAVQHEGVSAYVHRLVASAFVPNPDNKPDVAHWDNDGTHNSASNLRWSTEAENMADKKRHGTLSRGETHGNSKLSDDDVRTIRELRQEGVSVDELANRYGVSRWTIYDAASTKRTWSHIV